ncbi:hypothetical protein [Vibrio lentus]|uniref:hypothetical protein n=1 Tax=Vibrio lentus TaxID=136468 RepID=UPI000C852E9C|nr:hypothetical protein [Vibrio lentus]PMG66760.1 hypothetical protein BCU86_12860 [Vibrio lentus]
MPNITEELQELKKASQAQTSASQQLADEVSQKMGAIDKKTNDAVTNVWKEHQKFKDSVQNIIPTPLNLYKNSLMRAVESDGRPVGYASRGCTIEAVHPFTKGFEGPYCKTKPQNAVDDVDSATRETPYWYGVYNKGTRIRRGGLGDGWSGIRDGNILKITSKPETGTKSVYIGVDTLGKLATVRIRAWVKVVSGTLYMGSTSGYYDVKSGSQYGLRNPITKADTEVAEDGWLFIDRTINISEITNLNGNAFCFGLHNGEESEIYIALPHLSVPMRNENMLTSAAETRAEPVFTPCDVTE